MRTIHRFHVLHPICRCPVALACENISKPRDAVCLRVASAAAGPADLILQPSPKPADENSHNLSNYETTYTFQSDFEESKLGHGDSLYDDFSYDHRFLITGKWYFRAGVEYERYDFGGTNNGLPDHLQGLYGHLALGTWWKIIQAQLSNSILDFTSKITSAGTLSTFPGERM